MKTFNKRIEALDYSLNNPLESVEFKTYWDTGNLWGHCFYVNGLYHGEFKLYYSNGQLWEHYFIVDGELHGEWKSYHKNGQLWEHCFYVTGKVLDLDHLTDGSYKSLCILITIFDGNIIDAYI